VLELSCIIVAGAAGLRMGWALIDPRQPDASQALPTAQWPWIILGTMRGWSLRFGRRLRHTVGDQARHGARGRLQPRSIYWGLVLWRAPDPVDVTAARDGAASTHARTLRRAARAALR
jgi:hypothetical protein